MNRTTNKMDEAKTFKSVEGKLKQFSKRASLFIYCTSNNSSNIKLFDKILIKNCFDVLGDVRRGGKKHVGMKTINPKNVKTILSKIRERLSTHSYEVVDWSLILSK